ncbi:GNAT family N-acetyltransferase [Shewanella sp. UCD-KL12]|uniref:GNAT family N-acetyltransferase n=1 Tax=Shewanella sp. UCD-KL12 TaxID=1917163 RepID=UPI00097101E5|nr:GNAT family N-acetyltransferase [Shewanella sp. UCD-KL12]
MKQVAVTDRLILREFSPQDAKSFYLLNSDPEVVRFTGDVAFDSVKESEQFIETYSEYELHGFGRWSLIDKVTGEYFGFCGLRRDPITQEVDLGFRLLKSAWGKGFAYEAACAALKIGAQQYGVKQFVANAMRDNQASIKLLERLGFTPMEAKNGDSLWLRFVLAYDIEII